MGVRDGNDTAEPPRGPACSRVGCAGIAAASFAFDARACLVWLDPVAESRRGAGVLCAVHADRLTAPRGWTLQDRRVTAPRLWAERPVAVGTPREVRRQRSGRSRPWTAPAPLLPFDTTVPSPASSPSIVPAAAAAPGVAVAAKHDDEPWSPHQRPGPDFAHVIDAHTPLLARALEGARDPTPR